jgi:probable F420-dependent oxidoreductase
VTQSTVRFGAAVPQRATAGDPIAARDFAQAVEQLGYAFLETYVHVLGASRAAYPDLDGPYRSEDPFWEPFVLFGYLAGQTRMLEFVPGVIVLAQRQTALVAKQAAIVDVLSEGRLRLGVGTGWNPVEFEALGENFRDRGKRSEEQIALLRELWTKDVVTFRGAWHTVVEAGINPLPVQPPIPLWIGGEPAAVADRIGRLGDGWIVVSRGPAEQFRPHVERMHAAARAGVNPTGSDSRSGCRSVGWLRSSGRNRPQVGERWVQRISRSTPSSPPAGTALLTQERRISTSDCSSGTGMSLADSTSIGPDA